MEPCGEDGWAERQLTMYERALLGLLSLCTALAQAQPYPSKVVRVIVLWPGGSNDAAARLVFQKIAEVWG